MIMESLSSTKEQLPEGLESGEPIFAAVVLHYLSTDLTRECIASLQNLDRPDIELKIVVVDNASPNGSGEELQNLYASDENVHVLINEKNLGFSAANNKGFEYAVATWHPTAILVLNNDIQIVQEDFMIVLQSLLHQNDVYVISPDVYAPRIDAHQSPIRSDVLKPIEIRERIEYCRRVLDGTERRSLKGRIKALPGVRRLLELRNERRKRRKNESTRQPRWNVVPSGAVLVFSKRFIKAGEPPFDPVTFLYYEEDILALKCERNGWGIRYSPELRVLHLHEGTTGKLTVSDEEKERFIAKHYLDSLSILLCCYEDKNERSA